MPNAAHDEPHEGPNLQQNLFFFFLNLLHFLLILLPLSLLLLLGLLPSFCSATIVVVNAINRMLIVSRRCSCTTPAARWLLVAVVAGGLRHLLWYRLLLWEAIIIISHCL